MIVVYRSPVTRLTNRWSWSNRPSVSSSLITANALSFRGTDRIFFDFEFDAGIFQTRPSRSIRDHVAPSASFSRQPVLRRNMAIRQTVRFESVRRTPRSPSSSASLR